MPILNIDETWFGDHQACKDSDEFRAKHPDARTPREWVGAAIADGSPRFAAWLLVKLSSEDAKKKMFDGFSAISVAAGFPGKPSDLSNFIAGKIFPTNFAYVETWLEDCLKEVESCLPQA
jgi:hypothetical protein